MLIESRVVDANYVSFVTMIKYNVFSEETIATK